MPPWQTARRTATQRPCYSAIVYFLICRYVGSDISQRAYSKAKNILLNLRCNTDASLAIKDAMSKSFLTPLCKGLGAFASLLLPLITFAATPPGLLDNDHAAVRAVVAVQEQVTADWMRQPEVLGTAVGLDAAGTPALVDLRRPRCGECR